MTVTITQTYIYVYSNTEAVPMSFSLLSMFPPPINKFSDIHDRNVIL
jgi:hypothetical protein